MKKSTSSPSLTSLSAGTSCSRILMMRSAQSMIDLHRLDRSKHSVFSQNGNSCKSNSILHSLSVGIACANLLLHPVAGLTVESSTNKESMSATLWTVTHTTLHNTGQCASDYPEVFYGSQEANTNTTKDFISCMMTPAESLDECTESELIRNSQNINGQCSRRRNRHKRQSDQCNDKDQGIGLEGRPLRAPGQGLEHQRCSDE